MNFSKKNVANIIVVLIIIVSFIIRINNNNENVKYICDAICLGLFGILIEKFINYIYEYNFKLLVQSIIYRNKMIRVSFAYLFRIKIDGVYFLVKGSKIRKFQPVGGVYQYFDSGKAELDYIFESSEKMKENSQDNQNDIRGYVRGKNLKKFIKWFESRKNREVTCDREFIEELVLTGIVERKFFEYLKYRYIGSHHKGIFKTERPGYEYEYLIADIYEFIPTDDQVEQFRNLKKIFDNERKIDTLDYAFATKEEIKSRRFNKTDSDNYTENITNHSFKILEEVEYELY